MTYQQNFSLAEFTTWKIGGLADWCARPTTPQEVQDACRWAIDKKMPITVLSGGSNVLISDDGIEGLVLLLDKLVGIDNISYNNDVLMCECLAGTRKSDLLKVFVKQKLSPAIFLAGLPGDVGGGVVMNAGVGHDVLPKEFVEITDWIEYVPFDQPEVILRKEKKDIKWTYRHSSDWGPGVITRVGISWVEKPQADLLQRLQGSNQRRMASQPLQWPSCGSTFKNPPGYKAGRLIEECGLKGFQVGGAQVSDLHANFILNRGGAMARDIIAVVHHVQQTVKKMKNVDLEWEYKFLGR
jgi:UDP-N-acetylmuramate dehydrogenase